MAGKRIVQNGTPLDYTCENTAYKTDITRGNMGSVTPNYLFDDGENVLSLEFVIEKASNKSVFWFMWYRNGIPTIPMSAVMDEADITEVIKNISSVKF